MLQIVHYPNTILTTKTQHVPEITLEIKEIVNEMISMVENMNAIGLAANQVGKNWRIFVMQCDKTQPAQAFINPDFISQSNNKIDFEEGCLSFPGLSQQKKRADSVEIQWTDINGNFHQQIFDGLESICIQHETDHLNGITFIDDLSPLKKQFALKKYHKTKK